MLNLIPWWARALALLVFAASLVGFGYVKGLHHEEAVFDAYKAAEAQQSLKIQTETIAKTQAMQLKKDEALNAANEREKNLRTDIARGSDQRDGLRHELADSRSKLSGAFSDSLRKRVAALEDVFEQCSGRYQELAGHADRFASDALTLEQSWPK